MAVDHGAQSSRVRQRRHATDRVPRRVPDQVGIRAGDVRGPEHVRDGRRVDLVVATGEHQHGLAVRGEDERLHDGPDGNAECCGGLLGGTGRLGQLADLGNGVAAAECGGDTFDVGMHAPDASAASGVRSAGQWWMSTTILVGSWRVKTRNPLRWASPSATETTPSKSPTKATWRNSGKP